MESISLKSLALQKVFSAVSALRLNKSGYFFVTLTAKDGKANNVYFSKTSDAYLKANYEAGEKIDMLLAKSSVFATENADGELRHKLVLDNASEYTSVADIFGFEEESTDFVLADFVAEFTAEEAPAPAKAVTSAKAGKKKV